MVKIWERLKQILSEPEPRQCPPRPPGEYAVIGGRGPSGVWQPTGARFEVMFRGDDPAGQFYMRERK